MGYIYGIQSGLFIKIGVAENISARLKTMNLYNPHPCKVVARRFHTEAYQVERAAHAIMAPYAIGREWFMADATIVRLALTVAVKRVEADRRAWWEECAAREQKKTGRVVDDGTENEKPYAVDNIRFLRR